MPRITLYGVPVSAFVAKVRVVLDIKGLVYDECAPPGGYGSPAYRAIVPAGSVPGVVIDGAPLHDSNAIVEYLDDLVPDPPLRPGSALDRARMRGLLGFHDTRVEAAARALFPVVKRDWRAEPETLDDARARIDAALDRLGDMIAPAPFAFGARPGLADLAYPATLAMTEALCAEIERPLALPPALAAWCDATARLPAVDRSLGIIRAAMEDWLAGFRRTRA